MPMAAPAHVLVRHLHPDPIMSDSPDKSKRPEEAPAKQSPLAEAAAEHPKGFLMGLREWADALIIAFVFAMFIRTFVVELFKIPSGSMTPTLLGDFVAEGPAVDASGQSSQYLLVRDRQSDQVQVFRKDSKGFYAYEGGRSIVTLTTSQRDLLERNLHLEEHRIFVNKFAYWFREPDRGDIVVFRVPFGKEPRSYERDGHRFDVRQFNRNMAVYVKRAVAFGGETVEVDADHRLRIDGKVVESPTIFQQLRYYVDNLRLRTFEVKVQPNQVFMFGDNSDNSLDSRYWDGVPIENLRGKAFFRYWPLKKWSFLD
ncbi:MAG: signal peptidase I [Candidatus Sumerlaeaceae bacterium]|nr:signal peptidase I [Candidatus Sumerlaeaceae bacterium]